MSDYSNSYGDGGESGGTYHASADSSSDDLSQQFSTIADQQVEASAPDLADQLEAASEPAVPAAPLVTLELSDMECRVLGSLIEKEFLTPDIYPMTTNALTTACNQKTNRDPVVSYSPVEIDTTLLELRQREVVRRVHVQGSRSTKHRQTLDEAISLRPGELALMSVLMLRGAQTVGELRQRTERQHGFVDLDSTERCLNELAARSLVEQLERQPGHKEARWQHLLGSPAGRVGQGVAAAVPVVEAGASVVQSPRSAESRITTEREAVVTRASDGLEGRVETLEAEVSKLREQLEALADMLGESIG